MADEKPPEKHRGTVSLKDYERLAHAYLVQGKRSIRSLQAATGHSYEVCSRAISTGWPARNWPSLKERAELLDRQKNVKRAQPLTTEEVQALKAFLEMKTESVNSLRGISGFAQGVLTKLHAAAERATADREVTRRRVVVDERGSGRNRRLTHRVVLETAVLPPYLPHVAAAGRAVAEIVAAANDGLRRWMSTGPGEHVDAGKVESAGWNALTPEQQDYIIENDGKLPEGVTREMLGRGGKPGA